jgi:hypothetical protein
LSAADSARVHALAERDSTFMRWMDGQLPGTGARTMAQRSMSLMGEAGIWAQWSALERKRRTAVHQQLMEAGVEPGRLAFRKGTAAEVAAHRGAPGYRFLYDAAEQP